MKVIKEYLIDILKSFLIGIAVGLILLVFFFLIGMLVNWGSLRDALWFVRGGLLVVSALMLMISAAMMLMKKEGISEKNKLRWRSHFHRLYLAGVMICLALGEVSIAVIVDYYLMVWAK
ncbi:MAG: hypothetical protein IJ468_14720 [Lachnospiraceae bacterium]|nr:hypothetical protein [Lachnospiraceae bacterium]